MTFSAYYFNTVTKNRPFTSIDAQNTEYFIWDILKDCTLKHTLYLSVQLMHHQAKALSYCTLSRCFTLRPSLIMSITAIIFTTILKYKSGVGGAQKPMKLTSIEPIITPKIKP